MNLNPSAVIHRSRGSKMCSVPRMFCLKSSSRSPPLHCKIVHPKDIPSQRLLYRASTLHGEFELLTTQSLGACAIHGTSQRLCFGYAS
ncbi:hypothetical protein P8452_67690 [Trifolium repens]|nr:hypothetical protein P8452_67690 [Trifolium repens]